MRYISTRGKAQAAKASEAILSGLAQDGGLFVPEQWPQIQLNQFTAQNSFSDFAAKLLNPFFKEDVLENQIVEICAKAFDFPLMLKSFDHNTDILELYHGPTNAFKDFGARFLALATERLLQKSSREKMVLVATSGDTGGAVAAAFCQCTKIPVTILYPHQGVSKRQEHQLTCWGKQVQAFAMAGSFDDCQAIVKQAFLSAKWQEKFHLISANSINIGRLLPQMAYWAYASVLYNEKHRQSPSLIVPTGNMGNAVAALWAKHLGFPIDQVIFAHNANHAVVDFFKSQVWEPKPTIATLANAMDVGNPSNFERLLHLFPHPSELMRQTKAFSISDEEIKKTIIKYPDSSLCPHTAVGIAVRDQLTRGQAYIVAATAHPAKFETIVEPLLKRAVPIPESLQKILLLESKIKKLPAQLSHLEQELF